MLRWSFHQPRSRSYCDSQSLPANPNWTCRMSKKFIFVVLSYWDSGIIYYWSIMWPIPTHCFLFQFCNWGLLCVCLLTVFWLGTQITRVNDVDKLNYSFYSFLRALLLVWSTVLQRIPELMIRDKKSEGVTSLQSAPHIPVILLPFIQFLKFIFLFFSPNCFWVKKDYWYWYSLLHNLYINNKNNYV